MSAGRVFRVHALVDSNPCLLFCSICYFIAGALHGAVAWWWNALVLPVHDGAAQQQHNKPAGVPQRQTQGLDLFSNLVPQPTVGPWPGGPLKGAAVFLFFSEACHLHVSSALSSPPVTYIRNGLAGNS